MRDEAAEDEEDADMDERDFEDVDEAEGEEDEPPILEELGINFSHIVSKTRAVLWPRRSKLDQEATDSAGRCGRHVHTTRP